jgi:hypothetical protein
VVPAGLGTNTISFKYDPFGRRIQKVTAAGAVVYLYDGANTVEHLNATGTTNTTSFRSLTYDAGPQWQRGSWPTPMGNTHQTFKITAMCH